MNKYKDNTAVVNSLAFNELTDSGGGIFRYGTIDFANCYQYNFDENRAYILVPSDDICIQNNDNSIGLMAYFSFISPEERMRFANSQKQSVRDYLVWHFKNLMNKFGGDSSLSIHAAQTQLWLELISLDYIDMRNKIFNQKIDSSKIKSCTLSGSFSYAIPDINYKEMLEFIVSKLATTK